MLYHFIKDKFIMSQFTLQVYDFQFFNKKALEKHERFNIKIIYNLTIISQILTYLCKNILEFQPFKFKI
jgi:hypothetical protein